MLAPPISPLERGVRLTPADSLAFSVPLVEPWRLVWSLPDFLHRRQLVCNNMVRVYVANHLDDDLTLPKSGIYLQISMTRFDPVKISEFWLLFPYFQLLTPSVLHFEACRSSSHPKLPNIP